MVGRVVHREEGIPTMVGREAITRVYTTMVEKEL